MQSSLDRKVTKASVIDKDTLSRIVEIIQKAANKVEFRIKCSDDTTLQPTTLDEVLDLPNPKSRAITSVKLDTGWGLPLKIRIAFDSTSLCPIQYEVSGDDKDVLYISSQIEQVLESASRWYSPIAVTTQYHYMLQGGSGTLGALISMVVGWNTKWAHLNPRPAAVMIIVAFALVLFALCGNWVRTALFPTLVFAIGDGISRHERLIGIRKTIASGVLLALLVGIVGSVVANHL